eukprot:TRINITY_DN628_c0_g1_i1.p1 TRINITY_DN628_c0_g1~~TRINITY_DN628_c0_g1_i1.p1  ORF type:complete len:203 (-),score=37.61 TRINITY_DN628_c0_g1_i1:129-737(-)
MNQKICLLIAVAAVYLLSVVQGLSFVLEPKETRCFRKRLIEKDTFFVSYISSGENEEAILVTIKDSMAVLWSSSELASNEIPLHVPKNGTYQVCVKGLDSTEKIITLEMQSDYENTHLLISDEHLDAASTDLNQGVNNLMVIVTDVEGQQIREQAHSHIIHAIEHKIRLCSGAKVLILIFLTISQLCILTRLLGKALTDPIV